VITEYSEDDLVAPSVWPKYYVDSDHKPWILTEYIFIRSVLYRLRLAKAAFLNDVDSRMPDEAQLQRFKELVSERCKGPQNGNFHISHNRKSAKQIRVAGSDRVNRGSMQDHDGETRGYSSRTGLE